MIVTDQTYNPKSVEDVAEKCSQVIGEVEKAIIGKRETLKILMAAFLSSGGHILLEDYPGLGQTLIANSFAAALGLDFKRIQFTPDLLPGDITGGYILTAAKTYSTCAKVHLHQHPPGRRDQPCLAQNPIRPAGGHAGGSGVPRRGDPPLPDPFIVIATQNPIEYEGTFPLPEAQLDRFLIRLSVGYPTMEEEREILARRSQRKQDTVPLVNGDHSTGGSFPCVKWRKMSISIRISSDIS